MKTTWVIAADSSRARIFQLLGNRQAIEEIEDFIHPASREHDRDLRSDAQGRNFGKGEQVQGHSVPPRTDPSEHEAGLFSKTISDYLNKARSKQRYDALYLIAPPKFLGLLRQNLNKEAQRLVTREIPKDISWFDAQKIEDYIKDGDTSER